MSPRICICDDDPVVGELLQRELELAGFNVQEPLSGAAQAMGWLELEPPDVLLLDLNMPVGGGFDLLAWMKAQPALERTRVLMLTAEADAFFMERAKRLGASGYLVKPTRPGAVAAKVRRLVDDPGVRWIDDHSTLSAPAPPPPPPADGATSAAALNPIVAQLVRSYGEAPARSLLGTLAGQLEAFPARPGAADDVEREAHAVRGAASALGFDAAASACGDLERACRGGEPLAEPFRAASDACGAAARAIRTALAPVG